MATFLTTSRMDPALAERVEASVRGRKRRPGRSSITPSLIAGARIAMVGAIAFVVWSFLRARHRSQEDLERTRAALLDDVRAKGASLTDDDRGSLTRVDALLLHAAGPYEGDFISDDLRPAGALAATLARPLVYVRGDVAAFSDTAAIRKAASTSSKDPLVLCLLDPPNARTEKVLLRKVHAAYAGGALLEQPTANIRPLYEAQVGLPFLEPAWSFRVIEAADDAALGRLRRELERAPIENAKRAAKAELLLFAMDEPGDMAHPAELDGERPHDVRVSLVSLKDAKVRLRLRKHVDPSWISEGARPEYASGLDGCALARDLHDAVHAGATASANEGPASK